MNAVGRLARAGEGTTAVEFALTAPVYVLFAVAILQISLYLWTVLGLKHAVDMSARCAAIGSSDCADTAATQAFAATQAYGLTVDPERFTVARAACGSSVAISFSYVIAVPGLPDMTFPVDAAACVPAY